MFYSDKNLRLLCIQQSCEDCLWMEYELKPSFAKVFTKTVSSLNELTEQLQKHSWNLVISDYKTDAMDALEALKVVRGFSRDLPFLVVSEKIGEEAVVDLIKSGVEDVVLKSRLERLSQVVKRVLKEKALKEMENKATRMAHEAFAAKEQMLAIVSHDIKNPLSAIQLEAQMLMRAAERAEKSVLSDEVKIQSSRILRTTDRLKILISDLLDKNKTENGLTQVKKADVDGGKLCHEVLDNVRPLLQEKNITVKMLLPETPRMLVLDKNKIFQVLSNFLSNAIKFTPENGEIEVSFSENDHQFIFSVSDNGPGLKPNELSKVFEKYWTGNISECPGTGLGLFICKTIVEAHNGRIMVENIPKKGAKFWFTIPKQASFTFVDSGLDPRKKIYIVDDDEDLREVMCWALSKEGYAVHSFSSPSEALDCLLKERHVPELIVVDFHMDEMKGDEFLIRKNNIHSAQNCPVLMISASPEEVEDEVDRNFYKNIIPKPIDLEGLVDNVRQCLN